MSSGVNAESSPFRSHWCKGILPVALKNPARKQVMALGLKLKNWLPAVIPARLKMYLYASSTYRSRQMGAGFLHLHGTWWRHAKPRQLQLERSAWTPWADL